MAEKDYFAIITAGGTGSRLKANVPKQFLELNGRPVLAHSLQRFREVFPDIQLFVTLPDQFHDYWKRLCDDYSINTSHEIVKGGTERFHSIKRALDFIGHLDNGMVAIHDGVRPFVSRELIKESFETAENKGSAIPAIPLSNSLRHFSEGEWKAVDRSEFRLVQTPQVFELAKLQKAYEIPFHPNFTDDAVVFEQAGNAIHLIEGSMQNFKITVEWDLTLARYLAEKGF